MASIVLFDGVCNFCSDWVNFIISHDHKGRFKFAPLQSKIGRQLRVMHNIGEDMDSIVLIENGRVFTHSTAALRTAKKIGGIWSLAYVLIALPSFVRDFFYKTFAKNRYRLFGKKEACMIPTPAMRGGFCPTNFSLSIRAGGNKLKFVGHEEDDFFARNIGIRQAA